MTLQRLWAALAALLLFVGPAAGGQGSTISSAQATPFIGTWVFVMTSPGLEGAAETVRIWEKNGVIAASVQVGQDLSSNIGGSLKDGDLLVLTTTLRENGQPILGSDLAQTGGRYDDASSNDGTQSGR